LSVGKATSRTQAAAAPKIHQPIKNGIAMKKIMMVPCPEKICRNARREITLRAAGC